MTTDVIAPGRLDIARVFRRTFEVLGRNFATFFILALILVGLPAALAGMLQESQMNEDGLPRFGTGAFVGLFGILLGIVTNAILQGALIFGTVRDLNGERASVSDSLATGLRGFLPLIGLSILVGLGIFLGLILLIVPGIILACAWSVTVPALVAENRGVMGAFERSAELTRGNRWMIFALYVIYFLAFAIISAIIGCHSARCFLHGNLPAP